MCSRAPFPDDTLDPKQPPQPKHPEIGSLRKFKVGDRQLRAGRRGLIWRGRWEGQLGTFPTDFRGALT